MNDELRKKILPARQAALDVLIHNAKGPFRGLPRTAGWGYPEPYTRDLMISALGVLVSGNDRLVGALRRVLETLAENMSSHGHIPSLVHDPEDRGASDTTPLFLLSAALFRKASGEKAFLEEAVKKALEWMRYQSPSDRVLVAQLPTSDWRDEQWVLGFGLYVNAVYYAGLKLLGKEEEAGQVRNSMSRFAVQEGAQHRHVHEGLVLRHKPYYALWSYKIYSSERFDLLGNSLSVVAGIASSTRSRDMTSWIEAECANMKTSGDLAVDLSPNLFPFIRREDPDWRPRYRQYNMPGEYHNGGIWPFICGFHIAALVAAERYGLAEKKLSVLTDLVRFGRDTQLSYGFNEWYRAQNGEPCGQDWQTWSAAMYLYAAACVEKRVTPFFEDVRDR